MPAKGINVQVMGSVAPIIFTSEEANLTAELDNTHSGVLQISKGGVLCGEFNQAVLIGWWYA
jgi:hypothetical protein